MESLLKHSLVRRYQMQAQRDVLCLAKVRKHLPPALQDAVVSVHCARGMLRLFTTDACAYAAISSQVPKVLAALRVDDRSIQRVVVRVIPQYESTLNRSRQMKNSSLSSRARSSWSALLPSIRQPRLQQAIQRLLST